MKNRMRELRSFGSVRGEGGNVLAYSEETFLTSGESTVYGLDVHIPVATTTSACCAPGKVPTGAVGAQQSKCCQ